MTAPTDLIANELIRFHPPLPEKVAAAAGLPLGLADKVMLALDDPDALPRDGHLYGAVDRAGTGSYHLRPLGQPCISGFFGGTFARQLEDAGEGALAAQAIDELVALIGCGFPQEGAGDRSNRAGRTIRSHAAPIHMRCPAMPTIAPRSLHPSTTVCFFRRRGDLTEFLHHRAWRAGKRRTRGEGSDGGIRPKRNEHRHRFFATLRSCAAGV